MQSLAQPSQHLKEIKMNIKFSTEAQLAFNSASLEIKQSANSLLGSYAQYANRHSLPGKNTLKNISKEARNILGLPSGTQVFVKG